MSEAFIKALKWCCIVVCIIGGLWGMSEASALNDFRYLMVSVLSFGVVYLVYRSWGDIPLKVMLGSVGLVIICAVCAQPDFAPLWYFQATGDIFPLTGYFKTWAALVATLGTVLMSIVFYKFDDSGY